jgi:hypothetical protein
MNSKRKYISVVGNKFIKNTLTLYNGITPNGGVNTIVVVWNNTSTLLENNPIASSSSSSSKVCSLYSGFPSPKTKFRHLSLSLISSSVSPWFVMLRLTPSIHLSLCLPLLRVPSRSHSKMISGSLFPGILFTCPNHRSRFSSIN